MSKASPKKTQAKHYGEETVSLRHDFTDTEYREIGGKLNIALNETAKLETELKNVSQDYKARIAQQEATRDELNNKLGNGYEMRQTKVAVTYDPKRGVKTFFALDDKKRKTSLREEVMRPSDFQVELPGMPPAATPAPATQPTVFGEAITKAVAVDLEAMAVEVIRSEGKCTATLIQRRLKIDYATAENILASLEKQNAVGPATGAKAEREILTLPDPKPTGAPAHDTTNPPPVPAKKKSDKRKPTKAEFQAQQDAKGEGDK